MLIQSLSYLKIRPTSTVDGMRFFALCALCHAHRLIIRAFVMEIKCLLFGDFGWSTSISSLLGGDSSCFTLSNDRHSSVLNPITRTIQLLPVSVFMSSTSTRSFFAPKDASGCSFSPLCFLLPHISFKLDCWGGAALIFFGIVINSPMQLSAFSCEDMMQRRTQCFLASHTSERQTTNCNANVTTEHKQTRLVVAWSNGCLLRLVVTYYSSIVKGSADVPPSFNFDTVNHG